MINKYDGPCFKCGETLPRNTVVEYDPFLKRISHVGECPKTSDLLKTRSDRRHRNHTQRVIEAGRSPKGGFTKATLAAWGVTWPPPKGWRKRLELEDALKDYPIERNDG